MGGSPMAETSPNVEKNKKPSRYLWMRKIRTTSNSKNHAEQVEANEVSAAIKSTSTISSSLDNFSKFSPCQEASKAHRQLFLEIENPALAIGHDDDDSTGEDSLQLVDIDLHSLSDEGKLINDSHSTILSFEDDLLSLESIISAPVKPSEQVSETIDTPTNYRRAVSFTELHTRQHAVVLGDHPCCNNGLPVALGWEVQDECSYTVDEYERLRKSERKSSRNDLRLSLEVRRDMILESSPASGEQQVTSSSKTSENAEEHIVYNEQSLRRVERKLSRARRECTAGVGRCRAQQRKRVQHQEAQFFQQPPAL
mmetsp:Transcript_32309/g.36758  ORF Transcript_32309/g.36758 Transcript_32309/m.36758 type:complete len:311 (+) Transcript_32309:352-1284(+)|eukprot:CAMPEP_0194137608 /NCGR_PEP_ID=MMETSP0152-20130528/7485_1 /TAXON_ID=1049557 /ORGANISM="Thalassiothrix antarctica, Strain L6-D1" /LENGTH=310 /DNA_ID=CAMNT_0038834707 /DNA_START=302 /DNA_END=1234 /DNA_ORIENTATION=+